MMNTLNLKSFLSLLFIILFFSHSVLGQNGMKEVDYDYEIQNFQVANDSVYYTFENKRKYELHSFALGEPDKENVRELGKFFRNVEIMKVESEFMYASETDYVYKLNMKDFSEVWKIFVDSKMAAQCEPQVYGKYVTFSYDDRIFVADTNTGELITKIKGSNIECDVNIVDDKMFYSKFNGTVICYDLKTKKKIWNVDVGESSGFGITKFDENVILPSWSAKINCVNINSGEKVYTINMKEIKSGCGSGFEEAPVVVGDNFYAPHLNEGFFIFNKNTGKLVENIEFADSDDVVGGCFLYKDVIWYASETKLYGYSLKDKKVNIQVELPNVYRDDPLVVDNWFMMQYKDRKKKEKAMIQINLDEILSK